MEYVKGEYFPLQASEHNLGISHPCVLFSSVLISTKKTQNQCPSHPVFTWPSQESWRNKEQLEATSCRYRKANGSTEKWHINLVLMSRTFNKSYQVAQS